MARSEMTAALRWKRALLVIGAIIAGELLLPPLYRILIVAIMAWCLSAKLRAWIRPMSTTLAATIVSSESRPTATSPVQPQLCVMGPEHATLRDRVDPLTRTPFALGEPFVLCGGRCGRAYKLVTCEQLRYQCPADGSSLRVNTLS
jgi:hypothetical protein